MLINKALWIFGILLIFSLFVISVNAEKGDEVRDWIQVSKQARYDDSLNQTVLDENVVCRGKQISEGMEWNNPQLENSNLYCYQKVTLDNELLKTFTLGNGLFLEQVQGNANIDVFIPVPQNKTSWAFNTTDEIRTDEFGNNYTVRSFVWEILETTIEVRDPDTDEIIDTLVVNRTQKQKIIFDTEVLVTKKVSLDELGIYLDELKKSFHKDRQDETLNLEIMLSFSDVENSSLEYGIGFGNKNLISDFKKDHIDVSKGKTNPNDFVVYLDPFVNVSGGLTTSFSYIFPEANEGDNHFGDSFGDSSPLESGYLGNFLSKSEWKMEDNDSWTHSGSLDSFTVTDAKEGTNAINFNTSTASSGITFDYTGETNGGLDLSDYENIEIWAKADQTTSEAGRIELRTGGGLNRYSLTFSAIDTYQHFVLPLDAPNTTGGGGADLNNITLVTIQELFATSDTLNMTFDALYLVKSGGFTNSTRTGEANWGEESGVWSIVNTTSIDGTETFAYSQTDNIVGNMVNNLIGSNYQNFTAQFKLLNAQDNTWNAGAFFRGTIDSALTGTSNYGYQFLINLDDCELAKYNSTGSNTVVDNDQATFNQNQWYDFKLQVNGDKINAYYSSDSSTWTQCIDYTEDENDENLFSGGNFTLKVNDNIHIFDDILITQTPDPEKTKNAVLLLPFDSGANDESEARRIPSLVNATHVTNNLTCGDSGSCFDFDGGGQTIQYADDNLFDASEEITLGGLVSVRNLGSQQRIISKAGSYALYMDATNVFRLSLTGLSDNFLSGTTRTAIANERLCVIGVYNTTDMCMYINGVLDSCDDSSGNIDITVNDVYIGSSGGTTEFWGGLIDEPFEKNKAMTPEEIKRYSDAGCFASQSISKNNNVTVAISSFGSDDGGVLGETAIQFFDGNGSVIYESPRANVSFAGTNSTGDLIDGTIDKHGVNGTLIGDTECNQAGRFGNDGCVFDGVDDRIETSLTENDIFNTSGFSLATFIKPDGAGEFLTNAIMIHKADSVLNQNGLRFAYDGDQNRTVLGIDLGASRVSATNSVIYGNDKLYCVVATVDSNANVNFYVDSKLSGTPNQQTGAISGITTTDALNFGSESGGTTGRTYDGLMTPPKIYEGVLTANQVADFCADGQLNTLPESFTSTKNQSRFANTTAINSLGQLNTITSNTVFTLNSIPTIPILNLLENDTLLASTTTNVALNWSNSTDEDLEDSILYYLEVGNNSDFSVLHYVNASISETSNTTGDLIDVVPATYYWRVLSTDSQQNSSFSEIRTFRINDKPNDITIVLPENNTYTTDTTPTIEFENATDKDNDALTYNLEVYNDTSLTEIAYTNYTTEETANTTKITITNILDDGDYFIKGFTNDTIENSTEYVINLTIDTTFPTIYATSPSNGSTFYTGVPLDVSSDEVNAEAWWYSINDGANTSFSPNTTLIVAVSGDDYFIDVYVNDTLGHQNGTGRIYFTRGNIGVGGGGGGSGSNVGSNFIGNISVIMPSEWEIGEQIKLDLEFLNTLNNLYTPSSVNFFFQPTDYFEDISLTEKSTGKAEAVFRTRFTAIEGDYKIIVVAKADNEKVEEFNFKVIPRKEKISAENIVEKTVDAGKEIIDKGVAFIQNRENWTNWQKIAIGSAVTVFLSVIVISSVIAIKRKPKFPRRNDEIF